MDIVESFISIQGEGKFSGRLAIFVRFAGCNFNCYGFGVHKNINDKKFLGCDTIRAVFTKDFADQYTRFTPLELYKRVCFLKAKLNPIVVITGGEPLLYYNNNDFLKWLELLLKDNFEIHFETNASLKIDFEKFPLYKKCIFALGVKLSNSKIPKEKRLNFDAIKAIVQNAKDSFYKFVLDKEMIKSNKAKIEIDEILAKVDNEVYCMPMGYNEEILKINALEVAHFCIKNGYNYSDRMHIRLWNDKEGV
ncbi:7-carboxy-7-deazaguanine synthase QueE [Campylobacter sp. TTU-622]|uniref:7-carboxy-7-deazaguanine synthase QueE n=1 Tax=unclassified Campylobacter TaxID=2593542 RepID=UPI001902F831|nr:MULTISPECIES: 7-carboxy-7-deazaguanine synthase QueE [unclassified Campylobacter]MBK1971924.1 7-carboxy-7-deazaguanine synthase QueE [Campylobacter sp. TTU_617]MBK1973877.1 7-carboxy-7-deazaguanine synthase QueE [Campylobacter sp. TTU-622]MBK1991533.1 7-carboxy-7-deazaguanine synthase QueE [Campylobacter sp. 2018MI34]